MLDFVRRHSRSWGIKALLIALIIVFIGWGGYLYQTRHANDIAVVGNHYITMEEYGRAYENMVETVRKQFGGNVPQKLLEALDIKRQALDSLIRYYLVLRGARELGLQSTPAEVRAAISKMPAFQTEGKFNFKLYRAVLFQNRLTPESFEKQVADGITASNAQTFITGQAVVTEEEVQSYYNFNNDRIKLSYALLDPASFANQVKIDDAALKAFYKKNQNRYMEPEKREIAYVVVKVNDLEKDIHPTESRIQQYYNDNAAEFTHGKQVRAQRILLRVKPDASGAELAKATAEAEKILNEARKGKDFSTLAAKYSQDEATAKNGGELGFFSYKKMSPAFSKAAFALKPGQISGIVRTPSGLNIIKVEEVRKAGVLPLNAVKDDIIKDLKSQGAANLAYKDAQHLSDLAYAKQDIARAALELKMKVSDPVWITLSGNQPRAGLFTQPIREKLFQLGQNGVSNMLTIPGGYMVAQVKSIKTPEAAPFEKVKDVVTRDYRMAQANKLALDQASALLQSARAQKSLAAAAKADKIDLMQSGYFSRQEPDKNLMLLRGASQDSVFSLGPYKPFPQRPLKLGYSYMVCQFEGQKPAGAPSKEQAAEISRTILQLKQVRLWRTWLGEIAKTTKIEYLRKL